MLFLNHSRQKVTCLKGGGAKISESWWELNAVSLLCRQFYRLSCSPCQPWSRRCRASARRTAPPHFSTTSLPSARACPVWDGSPWWDGRGSCLGLCLWNSRLFHSVRSLSGKQFLVFQPQSCTLLFVVLMNIMDSFIPLCKHRKNCGKRLLYLFVSFLMNALTFVLTVGAEDLSEKCEATTSRYLA